MENLLNALFNDLGGFAIVLIVLNILVYIMPLIIAVDVNRIRGKNNQMQEELKEIKNLLIYQNEILNSMRTPPYNQYYQQQQSDTQNQQRPPQ